MLHRVKFDEKIKRFLNGQMTLSQELLFKHELLSDRIKIKRVQAILNQMKAANSLVSPNYDIERIAALESVVLLYYRDYGDSNEEFDASVDLFMKNKLVPEKEQSFKDMLDSSDQSRERAQFIALTIESMLNEGKEDDKRIIEAIKNTDLNDLVSLLNELEIPPRIAASIQSFDDEDIDDEDIAAWTDW